MAAPPTTVFDTAVVVWVDTVACGTVSPGIVAVITNWYVARFHTAATRRMAISTADIPRTDAHTSDRLVNWGRNQAKTAATSASDSSGPASRRHSGRCGRPGV